MRVALTAELREIARIFAHVLPLGAALRASVEFAAVLGMVAAVTFAAIASTTPAPRASVMVAEASR